MPFLQAFVCYCYLISTSLMVLSAVILFIRGVLFYKTDAALTRCDINFKTYFIVMIVFSCIGIVILLHFMVIPKLPVCLFTFFYYTAIYSTTVAFSLQSEKCIDSQEEYWRANYNTRQIAIIQTNLECCGWSNWTDCGFEFCPFSFSDGCYSHFKAEWDFHFRDLYVTSIVGLVSTVVFFVSGLFQAICDIGIIADTIGVGESS